MRAWLQLARISNLPTVWTNITAAWLLAGGHWKTAALGGLLAAGSLLYTGGMILNDAADVVFDREHRPERPIPSGQVASSMAWAVGLSMLVIGAVLSVLAGASVWVAVALVAAILFYDLYHKPWAGSVVVMGACRTLLYFMAASAVPVVAGMPAWQTNGNVITCALALGAYVVGITLAARLEHRVQGGELPVASSLAAFVLLYLPGMVCARRFTAVVGDPWQLAILAVFAGLVAYATQTMRKGGASIGQAVGLLLAGMVVVDALAVSVVSLPLAAGFVVLAPLLRLWQRFVAAT